MHRLLLPSQQRTRALQRSVLKGAAAHFYVFYWLPVHFCEPRNNHYIATIQLNEQTKQNHDHLSAPATLPVALLCLSFYTLFPFLLLVHPFTTTTTTSSIHLIYLHAHHHHHTHMHQRRHSPTGNKSNTRTHKQNKRNQNTQKALSDKGNTTNGFRGPLYNVPLLMAHKIPRNIRSKRLLSTDTACFILVCVRVHVLSLLEPGSSEHVPTLPCCCFGIPLDPGSWVSRKSRHWYDATNDGVIAFYSFLFCSDCSSRHHGHRQGASALTRTSKHAPHSRDAVDGISFGFISLPIGSVGLSKRDTITTI